MIEKVKVKKGQITKEIMKKDLPQYVALGWIEIKSDFKSQYQTYTRIK